MRATAVRRTVLTASAVTLTLMVTACGGGDGDGDSKAKAGADTAAAKPAAKALTAAELEKAVVTTADVKGYEVKKPGKDDVFAPGAIKTGKPECEPVALVMSALPADEPAASVQRVVTEQHSSAASGPSVEDLAQMTEEEAEQAMLDSLDLTKTMTSLWSYDGDGAQQTLAELRESGQKCAGGFPVTIDGDKQRVTKVAEDKAGAGEESLAWTVTSEGEDGPVETKVVVFRKGATLAGFSSFNIASVARGKTFEAPTALIEAQEAKLG
ncbi:hypothetical protein [Streptomyces fumanus]|uniref:hypothetical protein n=1 Tax=Streptomyces fumanus TaxID=67302 RepID=UPI0033CE7FE5